jgi:glutamine synthetase
MFSAAARHLARREAALRPFAGVRTMASLEQFEDYGKAVFTGKVADEYLAKHGSSGAILKDPTWVNNHSDTVAMAVFDW